MKLSPMCILFAASYSVVTSAAPLHAVIGFNQSTIYEHSVDTKGPQLAPIDSSLASLSANHSPLSLPQDTPYRPWLEALGSMVRVDSKQGTNHYQGQLIWVKKQMGQFEILTELGAMQLPLQDFYLLPLETAKNTKPNTTINSFPTQIYYQTELLSWTPQLSLIIQKDTVNVYQNALIHNRSNTPIELAEGVLHLSQATPPAP